MDFYGSNWYCECTIYFSALIVIFIVCGFAMEYIERKIKEWRKK